MSTEALRGTSRHQFLGRRNELSARLEMDRRKGQDGYGRRLRHQTRCDPSGSNLYRRSDRLGSVNHCGAGRSRVALQPSRCRLSEISRTLRGAFFDRRSRLPLPGTFRTQNNIERTGMHLLSWNLGGDSHESRVPLSCWSSCRCLIDCAAAVRPKRHSNVANGNSLGRRHHLAS
jgi:hypothetical protein